MRIAILAPPGVQMLDVAGPIDVFHEANNHVSGNDKYQIVIVASTRDAVTTSSGSRLLPDASVADPLAAFDTLLVAGGPGIQGHERDVEVLCWLRAQASAARRVGSICTGAFLLARAGLLNGRQVTAQEGAIEQLPATFPGQAKSGCVFVRDGSVYTSSGGGAAIHLALALVEADWGSNIARGVARQILPFLSEPDSEPESAAKPTTKVSYDERVADLHDWIKSHLPDDLSVETLASRLGMSVRNFARLFKRETEMTPGEYVQVTRVDAARRMLEESNSPLKRVAISCGFFDQSTLRRAFARRFHMTPSEYRRRLRAGKQAATVAYRAA
ncbi:GlxA family transcriptional regulator [Tardiphaga robiniae]|uniref:Helix-turn-helix domain-containing protein n=1 Tax=Tardiphaga robiniae TaxID=943830 RepID=A0A7G6TU14_9BRAD|nr:helix-turn-helix domain-containing protein [Tardiphaga robiniae]QND70246.1 helix-turn-helix domain-containing protein [Tardiphaga robiniae]